MHPDLFDEHLTIDLFRDFFAHISLPLHLSALFLFDRLLPVHLKALQFLLEELFLEAISCGLQRC